MFFPVSGQRVASDRSGFGQWHTELGRSGEQVPRLRRTGDQQEGHNWRVKSTRLPVTPWKIHGLVAHASPGKLLQLYCDKPQWCTEPSSCPAPPQSLKCHVFFISNSYGKFARDCCFFDKELFIRVMTMPTCCKREKNVIRVIVIGGRRLPPFQFSGRLDWDN